jgi:hypothetical protein
MHLVVTAKQVNDKVQYYVNRDGGRFTSCERYCLFFALTTAVLLAQGSFANVTMFGRKQSREYIAADCAMGVHHVT